MRSMPYSSHIPRMLLSDDLITTVMFDITRLINQSGTMRSTAMATPNAVPPGCVVILSTMVVALLDNIATTPSAV